MTTTTHPPLESPLASHEPLETSPTAPAPDDKSLPDPGPNTKLWLALAAVYLIWGSTYLAMHYAVIGIPPFIMGAIRFIVAGVLLMAWARLRGTPWPTAREWRNAAAIGVLLCLGGNGLVAIAQKDIDSGLTAVVVATMPLWLAVFSALAGQWPRRREWLGLLLGMAGVVVLATGSGLGASPGAAALLVLSPLSWAYGSYLMPRLRLPSGMAAPAAQMLGGGLALALGALVKGESMSGPPPSESILAVLYLVVFGSLVGFTAFTWLVRNARPAVASSYAYVNPGIAVLLGVLIGGEALRPELVVALPLIVGAVVLVVMRPRAPSRPARLSPAARAR